jgi:OTU domain-containing protein 5
MHFFSIIYKDGNCLFRAIALQIYGDSSMHDDIRARCCDFMAQDPQHFGSFIINEGFSDYIARKRQSGVHGNNPEIQAISELFNRPVEVFTPNFVEKPMNIFHAEYKTADEPIRVSYHDGNHYNAVIHPLKPTAGLGLGLPDMKPAGWADQMQVSKAVAESDIIADQIELKRIMEESQEDEVQRVLKESKLSKEALFYDDDRALQQALKESSYAMNAEAVSCICRLLCSLLAHNRI